MFRPLVFLGTLALGLAGCSSDRPVTPGPIGHFEADATPRAIDQFTVAQSARGAANDATLRDHHFDGPSLNTLGQDKLMLMTRGLAAASPVMKVYLATTDASLEAARREQVSACLEACGVPADRYTLVAGANPATVSPAESAVERLNSLRGNADEQSSDTTDASIGAGGGSR